MSEEEICKDVALNQWVIRRLLLTPGASLIIHDESDAQKTMGMIAPWMAGTKGSWMSHAYLFSEMHNSALGYTENIYGKWLEEVYKQLVEANRAMGDRNVSVRRGN